MARGVVGYGGSQVTITYGGAYTGGGPSGYTGGTLFTLSPTKRGYERIQEFVKTTNDQYHQAIRGELKLHVDLEGFHNDDGNPPPAIINAELFLVVIMLGLRTITCIVLNERWKTDAATSEGTPFRAGGDTDGAFVIA